MKKVLVRRIRTASVYKLVALGTAFGGIPLGALFGVLASLNLMTMNWNGEQASGLRALLVGPIMGLMFTLVGTALIGTVMTLGLWILSKFRPIEIEYEDIPHTTPEDASYRV